MAMERMERSMAEFLVGIVDHDFFATGIKGRRNDMGA
jgi:hypothetical protein